tara:strand:- start:3106 stop:3309 length:204 start_codon:yes stop_codon:yes gene_type:complete
MSVNRRELQRRRAHEAAEALDALLDAVLARAREARRALEGIKGERPSSYQIDHARIELEELIAEIVG